MIPTAFVTLTPALSLKRERENKKDGDIQAFARSGCVFDWIPAYAGMTLPSPVIPAGATRRAGI
jgi:hypothetical protein